MWIIHYYSCTHFIQTKQTIFPILPSYLPIQTPHCICLHASLSHDHCGAFAVSTVFISASLMCTWFAFTTLMLLHICPISLCMLSATVSWCTCCCATPLLCVSSEQDLRQRAPGKPSRRQAAFEASHLTHLCFKCYISNELTK